MKYCGDYHEDATVYIPFSTNDSDGASITVTDLAVGDIKIHKNGVTDEKASTDGVSIAINYDGVTGNHLITIDTSDNTGASGFWVGGADYQVRLEGITVDGQTINLWVGYFSIDNRSGVVYDTRVWLVDPDNGSDDNAGHSFANAKETIAATIAAAATGDEIHILGVANETGLDVGAKAFCFKGLNPVRSQIVAATGNALVLGSVNGIQILDLTITGVEANTGVGIVGVSTNDNLTIKRCVINGATDAIAFAVSSVNVVVEDCKLTGTYDAGVAAGDSIITFKRTLFQTDGTHTADMGYRAWVLSGGRMIIFDACNFETLSSTTTTADIGGLVVTGRCQSVLNNCNFFVNNSNASHTGDMFGVKVIGTSASVWASVVMNNSIVNLVNSASGNTEHSLWQTNEAKISVANCIYDEDNTTGTITRAITAGGVPRLNP